MHADVLPTSPASSAPQVPDRLLRDALTALHAPPQPAPQERPSPLAEAAWMNGNVGDFTSSTHMHMTKRFVGLKNWLDARLDMGCDPYSKSTHSQIAPWLEARTRDGVQYEGVNFASQDYLSLSRHAAVHTAAKEAIDAFGVHSAGSAALMGNTRAAMELEVQIADLLRMKDCTIFPTGWAAGYGTVKALARKGDHIVIDFLAHACLQEAARDSGANVHVFRHLSVTSLESRLRAIRKADTACGILVVTETLFSMDSDVSDIAAMQALATQYGATLMVDVAHDFGAIGADGSGFLGIQGMLGKVDVVMGSFSKTFAANGGFVCSHEPSLKLGLRYTCGPLTFTNAMSPVMASVVSASIRLIRSHEGAIRRESMMKNSRRLRGGLAARGFEVMGEPSAIVPMIIGDNGIARLMTKHVMRLGAIVNLVEYPAVSKSTCRWRLQVMAEHTPQQIDQFIDLACEARKLASDELASF